VVTEDVSTFSVAIALAPDHIGIVYCHHARLPRTRTGLAKLERLSRRWPRTRRQASASTLSYGGWPPLRTERTTGRLLSRRRALTRIPERPAYEQLREHTRDIERLKSEF
jgi:hypothetical protein